MLQWYLSTKVIVLGPPSNLSITSCNCQSWPKSCDIFLDDQKIGLEDHKVNDESHISVAVHKNFSCNETFGNIEGAHKDFQSFSVQKCSNPAEKETTTLIISHPVIEKLALLDVIKESLIKFSKVILVAFKAEIELVTKRDWYPKWFGSRFFTVTVESFGTYGDAMNAAIDLVTSPLVLVAPRLAYLNFDIIGQKLDV